MLEAEQLYQHRPYNEYCTHINIKRASKRDMCVIFITPYQKQL